MKAEIIKSFSNEQIGEIKGIIKDGEPWFLAGNACRALGIKNNRKVIGDIVQSLARTGIKCQGVTKIHIEDNNGRRQLTTLISEPILYELIFRSKKERAVKFRAWVTTEVLPSLRKYGEYRMSTKLITNTMHDGIKEKIVPNIESAAGKRFAYSNFHKLVNKSLGLPQKVERDSLEPETLEEIAHRENLVNALILEGKDYHQIKEILSELNR